VLVFSYLTRYSRVRHDRLHPREQGKTTGYYVPKGAEAATRQGVAAWQKLQACLRELAELNKERNFRRARTEDASR
jgi:hypothetical protein